MANALPLPESWPQYTTTIILGTILARGTVTLPAIIWSRRKGRQLEAAVQAELSSEASTLREQLGKAMAKEKATYDAYKQEFSKQLQSKHKQIVRKHFTSRLLSIFLPPSVSVPLFVVLSLALRQAAKSPTPLASESFLTLESLASADASGIMPVLIGLTMFANLEIRQPTIASAAASASLPASLRSFIWTRRRLVLESALRCGAIAMIVIAMDMPGAVDLYWLTSSSLTFIERMVFSSLDTRRQQRMKATLAKQQAQQARTAANVSSQSVSAAAFPTQAPVAPSTSPEKRHHGRTRKDP